MNTLKNLTLTILILLVAATSYAAETPNPFIAMRDTVVEHFKPVSGTVTAIEGNTAICNIAAGLKQGMRLDVYRASKPFLHPVTKEKMGFAEQFIGRVEVISTDPAKLKILSGTLAKGDIVRISEARVPVLYYPDSTVPWSVAEEYYLKLREANRFDIAEVPSTSIAKPSDSVTKAKELGALIVLSLSYENKSSENLLKERVTWVEDGTDAIVAQAMVSTMLAGSIAVGDVLFAPKEQLPVYNFSLPDTYKIFTAGDFEGSGAKVLAFGMDRDVSFFTLGIELVPALGNTKIRVPGRGLNVRLDAADIDGDGKDELIVSAMGDDAPASYVYKFNGKEFKSLWNGPAFLRVIDGKLYGQAFSKQGGFKGPIFPVLWDKGDNYIGTPALDAPPGSTLYSFYPVSNAGEKSYFTYNSAGYLVLKDSKGMQLWASKDIYNITEGVKEHDANPLENLQYEPEFMDRMTSLGDSVLTIKKVPIVAQFKKLGNYTSQMYRAFPVGASVSESRIVEGIPGTVLDHMLVDGNLIVLTNTWAIAPENILKLRTIFDMKLVVYKFKR